MPVFRCLKDGCRFRTSGIVKDVTSNRRWCPRCNSPLIQCNHCSSYVSGTPNGTDVVCDHCGKTVNPEYVELTKEWHGKSRGWNGNESEVSMEPVEFECRIKIGEEVFYV